MSNYIINTIITIITIIITTMTDMSWGAKKEGKSQTRIMTSSGIFVLYLTNMSVTG